MPTVAEILFGLGFGAINTDPLKKVVKESEDAAKKATAPWVTTGKQIATGIGVAAAAGAGLLKLVDSATKVGDAIGDSAAKARISTDAFQRLSLAAERGDVSMETLTKGLSTLSKNLDAAREGGAKPFVEALERIGLTTNDLGTDAEENLGKLADGLLSVADPTERTALSMALLGKSGQQLAGVLDGGSESLRAYGAEAEAMGLITEEEIRRSGEFQDAMDDVGRVGRSLAVSVATHLSPALTDLVDDVTDVGAALGSLSRDMEESGDAVQDNESFWTSWIRLILTVPSAIADIAREIGNVDTAIQDAVDSAQKQARDAEQTARNAQRDREGIARENERREKKEERELEESLTTGPTLKQAGIRRDPKTGKLIRPSDRKGGGGSRRTRPADFSAEDFEQLEAEEAFGGQLDRFASQVGATAQQRQLALEAAASARARGASDSVALKAGQSQIESLTGAKVRTHDPMLSDLLGTDVPDVKLSQLSRGAEPQVLVSHITNTFTFNTDLDVNGAGDAVAVAERTVDVMKDSWRGQIEQATKTVKIRWDR